MIKKYFGILCLMLGGFAILAGFIVTYKIIIQNNVTISNISILVNTLIFGVPAIIYGLKFIRIDNWKRVGGIITMMVGGIHMIYLLFNLFYMGNLTNGILLMQVGVSFGLLIYGYLLKIDKIIA
ncbi:MAG: hypothetical protein ACQERJ_06945 [Bacillota bacterium]